MGDDGSLTEARATIARQAKELARLRQRLADERFAEQLGEALALAAAAGRIASPVSHGRLLEMIVETAAQVIGARAGALFLVDFGTEELIFEVAIGPKAAEVKRFRVPLGHGIAGLVAVSGQPMAVSDASRDPRQAADIARDVGYAPESILCVPLFHSDRVIGVLELLDKEGALSFGMADITTLGLFANQAAVAIEQSRAYDTLADLLGSVLGGLGDGPDGTGQRLRDGAQEFAARLETVDAAAAGALDLARLVQEIVWQGDHERAACQAILEGFAAYLRSRPNPLDGQDLGGSRW